MVDDWLAIRNDYINGGGSYRKLAEKYGVTLSKLRGRAEREDWPRLRTEQQHKTSTETAQKTQEKISDALSDRAATQARIAAKVTRMVEGWIDKHAESTEDTGDIRRIVQSCVDMGIFDVKAARGENSKNNLLEAIQTTEEIATDDLPEIE